VLTEARAGLDKDGGLPSAHALHFISARLLELDNLPLADAIDDALLKHGIRRKVSGICFSPSRVALLTRCWPPPFRPIPAPSVNGASGFAWKDMAPLSARSTIE
jgi:hypothetical protein